MSLRDIEKNAADILAGLPNGVQLVAAAKTRSGREIKAAIDGGVKAVGHNYVGEAQETKYAVMDEVQWHMIGHLQRNKVKKAVEIFNLIESLDSWRLAAEIDKVCKRRGIIMPCLVEINSGREKNKYGIFPEDGESFILKVSEKFKNLRIKGLMTMGPFKGNSEDFRPYFKTTKELFDNLKKRQRTSFEMKFLSMGMTSSYRVAIEEGANIVRIGTAIFGPRKR